MKDFAGKIAVITGGGAGMGAELAKQLVRAGAHVAICDVFADNLAAAEADCRALAAPGIRVSAHLCDVADEAQVVRFKDEVLREHASAHIDLLFNNAGIGGGNSFVAEARDRWERTFNVSWLGVYYGARTFLPLLLNSEEGWIVNTSSVHGFMAIEPGGGPQSAYATAKFAIKGFSEALVADLRAHAPHVHVALVMPGHIGTSIVENTLRSQRSTMPADLNDVQLGGIRERMRRTGAPEMSDEQLRALVKKRIESFREHAPMTAAEAATVILDGIRAGRWRILVGDDAHELDALVREHPEGIYEPEFLPRLERIFPAMNAASTTSSLKPQPA